ncbi:hypothetical protein TRP8649_02394 [Pelagimonas phthalicica]|uniref:Uncharacterized protein n=1 Tax=Pelagimonas phthalicica TaxID=1037362 RepID=A0A238JC78_9RHOB|nr:hypothetical protein CLV87_2396 [Pelagimonas phthalicica]SMX28278.1 hypothetical protein TRP8649_02394 [Pelagimonas phthalicica]
MVPIVITEKIAPKNERMNLVTSDPRSGVYALLWLSL